MDYGAKNILAIDCSSAEMKLGLQFGGDRLVKSSIPAEQSHGSQIMKGIASLLHSADCQPTDLNAIVVATGPGSFTGLRVGIACAKGMAVALEVPVVGVSQFELAAYKLAGATEKIKVVFPFKKDAFFVASIEEGVIDESKIEVVNAEELERHAKGCLMAVIGGGQYANVIADKNKLMESDRTAFDASELIYLGVQKLDRNEIPDLAKLEPKYVLKSQAEIKFEERRNREA